MPKSPKHILRDTLERLEIDLAALSPPEQSAFIRQLTEELEERRIALTQKGDEQDQPAPN